MFQAPLWCSPPLLLPPCLWSRQNLWDSANPGVSPWKKSWGVARQLSTWWTVENGKVVVCKMKIVYNSVLSIDSFSLISHTYQCPHAIQICGFTPVKIANFSKNRRKKGWKHRHLRVGPISKFRPWVLNFPEKDPTFLTSLGSIKPTAGWPSPNLSICPAHRHQNRINFQEIPYHRKQGGIGINSEVFNQIALKWQPHLNPVLEITKPRSSEWTELVSCQKEAPFRNPPCSLPTNKNTTQTIHKRIFGALRLQATETSRQGRGPSGGAKIIVLCVSGADLRQVLLQTMGISNEKEELWWLKYCPLEFLGRISTEWKEVNKLIGHRVHRFKTCEWSHQNFRTDCLPSTSPLRRLP